MIEPREAFHQDPGRPLALDPDADSADPDLPAFLARPEGSPVYHGFPVLDDVEVDGFKLGKISDWEAEDMDIGDAFVVAPDNSRCGLVWSIGNPEGLRQVRPPEPIRRGVWGVVFEHKMSSREQARRNLAALVPQLRPIWGKWTSELQQR